LCFDLPFLELVASAVAVARSRASTSVEAFTASTVATLVGCARLQCY
jgi:hypothetical protein